MVNEGSGTRDYQRALIEELDAEMGRRRISRRELSRLSGIHRVTLDRIFTLQRDLNVAQWAAIAQALGIDPSELAARASASSVTPPKSDDPRTLIAWLLANPGQDEELNNRLSEAVSSGEFRGSALTQIQETIRDVRRNELVNALAALPPSAGQGGNRQSG
jgi:lambda repressor-like predicted transcriptional regulator